MTTYVSSSYSLSSVMFSYILAQMPRHSLQPVEHPHFATGTAQSVTSHLSITSHYFQQRFRSNIHVTLHGHQFTLYCFPANILWMQMWTKPWFPLHICTWIKVHTEAMVLGSWWCRGKVFRLHKTCTGYLLMRAHQSQCIQFVTHCTCVQAY